MKKYTILLIAIASLFIVSCDKQQHYKIGISQCSDDDWRRKMNSEIERELLFYPEIEAEIRSADDSNEKQIADIRYFIDNDFDIIIAAPNEAEAITPVMREAMEKGIPLVLFDRSINDDFYTHWQGADNTSIGRAAAEYVGNLVGDKAPVLEIKGLKGSTPADGRHAGFREKGLNVVGEAYGNWNYDDAARVADSLYNIYPNVRAVYAHNDRMAIAASDVAAKHGIRPYIIGIDGAPEIGVRAVKEGVIDATFIYPTEGQNIIRTAVDILEGKPVAKTVSFPASSAIDSSNVDIILLQNASIVDEIDRMQLLKQEVDDYWSQHNSQTSLLYAVIAIVVLLSILIFLLLRAYWQHKKHRQVLIIQNQLLEEERDKQKQLLEQLAAATNSKLAFFTNVSHDIRTPLTLIAEPIDQLWGAKNLTENQKALMKIADKNVKILQRLINQLLDFRKYENGRLDLNLEEVGIAPRVLDWGETFQALARRRDIRFKVDTQNCSGMTLAIDVEKMERIFFNLVSNAFKYTPDNGEIIVSCKIENENFVLSVSDTGKGIPGPDLPNIFDRFYQVERVHSGGSGLGLALAKAFTELHGGTISVVSELSKGTTFTVCLPLKHVENTGNNASSPLITADMAQRELSPSEIDDNSSFNAENPTILVIDDNADVRLMIRELLSDNYNVILAPSGTEGLRLAAKYTPDLVVCDVMMPGMDGMECCRRLKEEMTTSHIPVLMLTACAMEEQRVDGYKVGADAYLPKPFSTAVLVSRIKNLIENRKRVRDITKDKEAVSQPVTPSVEGSPDIDNEFYNRFLVLVNEQMSDPDLNVDSLASKMGLGRSQFYRKIKSLTNYSPVELLRRIRLARARKLLTSTEQTISEISYAVGFSTPAYFTKCYREAFGETPTELRTRLGKS